MSGIQILVGDHYGVYVPQRFMEAFYYDKFNVSEANRIILSEGPDNEFYWEAWDDVLRTAEYIDENDNKWYLYHIGDLFLYCEELMTEEERDNFFGH